MPTSPDFCELLKASIAGRQSNIAMPESEHGCPPALVPELLHQIAVGALKEFFSSDQRMSLSSSGFVYSKDGTKGLVIKEGYAQDFDEIRNRPSIYVSMSDLECELPPGIGSGSKGNLIGHDRYANAAYASLEKTNWQIRCLSGNYMECWNLAHEVKVFWQTYGQLVVKSVNNHISEIFPARVVAPQPMKEPQDERIFVATVIVNLKLQDYWTVVPERLPVRHIVLDVNGNNVGSTQPS